VDAAFWAALGLLVVATITGSVYVGVRAWRAWQACISLAVAGAAALEVLSARSMEAATKAERVAAGAEELEAAIARLQRSTARARILFDATGEVRDLLNAVRAFVPRK
jgi:hypothetical protein